MTTQGGGPKRVAQREQEPDAYAGGTVPNPLRSGTAALFPTPFRRDYRHGSDHPHGFGQRNLNGLALQYPTPRAHDRLPVGGGESEMNRHTPGLNAIAARYPTPTSSEGHARTNGNTQASKCLGALAKVGPSAQLNPDWVEWLMGWPVGWTDVTRDECDWCDLSVEPEDIHIATTRRENRPARIKAIGNGQVPLCAAVAAESGFAFLASLSRANPGAK